MISNLKGGPTNSRQFSLFARRRMLLPKKAILEAMTPIAEEFIVEPKAQGEDSPRMAFLIVTERRLWPIPEFSRFSRDEKVQKLPAMLISSELSAHQVSPNGVTPHWRSRPGLQLACGPIVSYTHAVEEFPRGPQGTTALTTPPFVS